MSAESHDPVSFLSFLLFKFIVFKLKIEIYSKIFQSIILHFTAKILSKKNSLFLVCNPNPNNLWNDSSSSCAKSIKCVEKKKKTMKRLDFYIKFRMWNIFLFSVVEWTSGCTMCTHACVCTTNIHKSLLKSKEARKKKRYLNR